MLMPDHDRFDVSCETLCTGLRWKGQYVLAERDSTVPPTNDGLFWCMYTQKPFGPDGEIAEPGSCASGTRKCHGSGSCG
ncbi:MAG TPA: hypothetical protein VEG32_01135 [Clostridia bacterium]|nr:hypothetical protein [Clostridia bacterium]